MISTRPQILLVDDTPANLQTLGRALSVDFDLTIATSGAMCLSLAAQNPPDLILLDVMMPEMDGYEVCQRLKADPVLQNIPVIFVTVLSDVTAESAGLALGAADYLTKPIRVDIARQRICNLLEREQLRKDVEQHRHHLEELVQARTEALSIAKEAAETANRAKSAFLAKVSHELRTPMNVIMGMTEIALRRESDPRQIDLLTKVTHASTRLMAVIDDVLDISALEAERLTLEEMPFPFSAIEDNLIGQIAEKAKAKQLEFWVELPPALRQLTLLGDPLRLRQILHCILDNAVRFTEQGSITLRGYVMTETAADVQLRFEVTDTGIGISAEAQWRLFSAFEQADGSMTRKHGGTGLGLAISKRLAKLMGGNIGVESQIGEGSTFWLTLHLGKSADNKVPEPDFTNKSPDAQIRTHYAGKRVALVEDDSISREVTNWLLEDVGLIVDKAEDSASALLLLQQNDYALILLDMQTPGLNTAALITAIHALPGYASKPIIAMTEKALGNDRQISLPAGTVDHIAKPADPNDLFKTLLRWLAKTLPS